MGLTSAKLSLSPRQQTDKALVAGESARSKTFSADHLECVIVFGELEQKRHG